MRWLHWLQVQVQSKTKWRAMVGRAGIPISSAANQIMHAFIDRIDFARHEFWTLSCIACWRMDGGNSLFFTKSTPRKLVDDLYPERKKAFSIVSCFSNNRPRPAESHSHSKRRPHWTRVLESGVFIPQHEVFLSPGPHHTHSFVLKHINGIAGLRDGGVPKKQMHQRQVAEGLLVPRFRSRLRRRDLAGAGLHFFPF